MNGNPFYEPYWDTEFEHHGVLGMEWGKRNGPPYPLDRGKDGNITKAQKEKKYSLSQKKPNKKVDDLYDRSFFQKHKKEIAIGTGIVATLLASYGIYKISKIKNTSFGVDNLLSGVRHYDGFKRLKKIEPLSDTLSKVNPYRYSIDGANNCVSCSIASLLRQAGYDVTAKPNKEGLNLVNIVKNCFPESKIFNGTAIKFGKSKEDAVEMLKTLYGDNAEGIVGIRWKGLNAGHAFNWQIKDGVVSFFDGQNGLSENDISSYFKNINQNGRLVIADLDFSNINLEELKKYINM